MSVIVISDVHGATHWKSMLKARKPGDTAVFLGDYFDLRGKGPFADSQVDNFREICQYTRANPDTHMLTGNHDYKYMFDYPPDADGWEFTEALEANRDLLSMVLVLRDRSKPLIFSHGGLTQTFMDMHALKMPEDVNGLWQTRPEVFNWIPHDPQSGQPSDRYGDDPWQSPIWARNFALEEDGIAGYYQVVGHTHVRVPFTLQTIHGDSVMFTCTLDNQRIILP